MRSSKTEYEEWRQQSLVDQRFVYIWVDGVHIKAGVARENAAVLTVIGADVDGRKHLICPGRRLSRIKRELVGGVAQLARSRHARAGACGW